MRTFTPAALLLVVSALAFFDERPLALESYAIALLLSRLMLDWFIATLQRSLLIFAVLESRRSGGDLTVVSGLG